jgi:putative ABC transport system ATP-binding protein
MRSAVEIHDLNFSYNNHLPVLDIKYLSISKGERVFIYGPSGCGKTTLLGVIAGVLDFQSGALSLLGNRMESKTHFEKDSFRGTHMGYIFQMFNLIPYLNAFENIVLPCKLIPERQKRIEGDLNVAVERVTKRLNIKHILQRRVTDLSVGQQQRVAAARALLGHPEIIIADEPTSALDSDHRQSFLNVLLEQAKETNATVLFVSHDKGLSKFFDRSISIPEINLAQQSGEEGE